MTLFTGAGTALVTPFLNGEVDFSSLGQLIDWQIQQDIDALIICGTTGEASTLNDEEHIATVEFAVKHTAGRVPVIGGAGSNDTSHAIEMSQALEQVGVDGLLLVTPYYNKCSERGLITHYTAIADSVDIPAIVYSVPGRTGVNISPFVVKNLRDHPNIVGIKEASGNIAQVVEIAKYVDDDFALYSGNDEMIVPLLSVGGIGAISVVSNIAPQDTHLMIKKYLDGDTESACKLQLAMKSLIDAMFCEVNPIPIKAALYYMGKIGLEYRLPLCEPAPESIGLIKRELSSYGLI
ncbi:MAG: 4-hydroxy-tetrahydrodipicolinate synthase [Clostridiales bacterium]|jgi:4-hydroxy-tetrahydrodipicolinate synthase|nr:4-hydroxy-tetrahydrodipicolinate synthase [Clostridiales bacterium]